MVEPEEPRSLAWWWSGVYAANLPLPLTVGALATTGKDGGLIGVMAAVAVVWLVGLGACYHLPRATQAVTVGGMYVAMLQFLPVFHLAAGLLAVLGWVQVGGSQFYPPGWRAELGGFAVTLLTALPLLILAWVLGRGPRLLFAPSVARTPDEADYVDPERPAGPGAPGRRLTTDTPGASGSASGRPAGYSPRTG